MTVGVIVAVDERMTQERADRMCEHLREGFPGVRFAILPGVVSSVAFEFEEEET